MMCGLGQCFGLLVNFDENYLCQGIQHSFVPPFCALHFPPSPRYRYNGCDEESTHSPNDSEYNMSKNFNRIIQQIQRKAENGDYNHADDDDIDHHPRRSTRQSVKPCRFVDTQSSVESSLYRDRKKKKKTTSRILHNKKRKILYDSDDSDDDESQGNVRREHIKRVRRNMMANRQREHQIEEHPIDVTDSFPVENEEDEGRNNYIPICQGGDTFCLREELNISSDDDDDKVTMVQNIRKKVVASYNNAQIAKREAEFSNLQSMRDAKEFDDEVSSDDESVAVKASVTGNNNVVNINNIRYTAPIPLSYGQQHHDGLLNIQPAFWPPPQQRQFNPIGYSWDQPLRAQYVTQSQHSPYQISSFPLQSSNHLTPFRTRTAEMDIRAIIEQWRSSGPSITDNLWLDKFESVLDKKLRGMVTGNFLSSSDSDWIRNEHRNRSGNRSQLQLDLICRLTNLRIN